MDRQRNMETTATRGGRPHLFPSLGPALLISMGYIDLGKWVTAVEAGSRFGYDLVLLVLLFNFSAILCQYLATCISMVTGKNLAEICHEEYSRSSCILLGLQAGLSVLTSKLTMTFGIAHGFNLLFGFDLITGICIAIVVSNLLPYLIARLDNTMMEKLNACIAGFALLCYVLGLLVSQPEIPLTMNIIFPKLSGEGAYSLMALLGANVMAHNFYIHSSVVQEQRRPAVLAIGALFHDHLFSILFIFTGIFLVNYVLMNSAAVVSGNAEIILNFQDVVLLMDQIFRNPMAPVLFLVVLLFSSQIISLTSNICGQMISQHFFGIALPLSGHHLLLNVLTVVPAVYCAKVAGAQGIYQLLIICQVIQAMLLPSSVIPLFRIASSRSIMGPFKISRFLEILAFVAFFGILFANIVFAVEMLFGDSSWLNILKGNTSSPVVVPYTVLLLLSCASIAFTLCLAVTPLKSASDETATQEWFLHSQQDVLDIPKCMEDNTLENVASDEDQRSTIGPVQKDSFECHPDKSALEYIDSSDTAFESDHDSQQSAYVTDTNETCSSPSYVPEESKSVVSVDWKDMADKVSNAVIVDEGCGERIASKSTVEKDVEIEADVCIDKDSEESHSLDFERSLGGGASSSTSDGPPSLTMSKGKGSDGGNGSGSLSRLSGLGRAARRQLAAILDEFWGHLFDYHGKLTKEATMKKLDILLGLDLRIASSSARVDNQATDSSKSPLMRDAIRGSALLANSRDLLSPNKEISSLELPYGLQMGSSAWSQSMQLSNTQAQSSSNSLLEQTGKLYSNFNLPSYSDNQFYQPATIHGYQLASYLKGFNETRNPYSSMPLDPQRLPKSSASAVPNYAGSVMYARSQNLLGSLGAAPVQSPTAARASRLVTERSYYDPSHIEGSENVGSTAYSKKYHSSPDISALIAASRNALLNEGNLNGPIGTQPYLSRLASDRARYTDPVARGAAPLAFDELSPPKLHRDVFSVQPSLSPNTKSLWAKQPFEQLFGMSSTELNKTQMIAGHRSSGTAKDDFSYAELEAKLLKSLRFCIMKLLKLEGSGWLFRQDGGCDEDLIDQVAAAERLIKEETADNQLPAGELQHLSSDYNFDSADIHYMRSLPNCGDDCIWRASLVVSFGVWCIRRILDLSLVESRPELWGKYTYVLNRLQGILDPAFSKPRSPLIACACLQRDMRALDRSLQNGQVGSIGKPIRGAFTTASVVLEVIKEVESAVSGRKGRTGTAAGDVAFPKGKENLASVLKRYKRRLSSKPSAGQ